MQGGLGHIVDLFGGETDSVAKVLGTLNYNATGAACRSQRPALPERLAAFGAGGMGLRSPLMKMS